MKIVFITGITGLLGTNLAEDLLMQGFRVKALIRNISKFTEFCHPNLLLIQGNLQDDIVQHLLDVDVFIHIAAVISQNLTKYADYSKINVNATRHLFAACKHSGVKKFIFVSSANTIGYGSETYLGRENLSMRTPFTKSMYAKSKREAEQYLLSHKDAIEIIILNPTFMIGNYDSKPSSGKIILMAWKKKLIFYPPGGKNFVDVKDVSQAIIQSIVFGQSGERYLISNENLSYRDFYTRLNVIIHQKPIMIRIPKFFLIAIGYFGDVIRRLNIKTSISSTNMKILCVNNYFSNEKSIKVLNISYHPIDKAITDAVHYFEKRNYR
jgi:nucleoside-diphosphate-sugar epimerase